MSACDVFSCIFPLDVQNEITLLTRVFCYLWLVCLLRFLLRNASLVKVRNLISDGIVFVFHLARCVRGFKVKVSSDSGLTWISLSFYCICCYFLISNFMKSSTVYAASLCTFVRFKTMIWPSIRFDISLQNFKKQIYFLTANRKKTFWRTFSYKFGCRKKTLSDFLASSFDL